MLICLMGVVMSCSSNDEDSKIEGTWQLTTRTTGISFDVDNDTNYSENLVEEIDCNDSETLTFKADGTVSSGSEYATKIVYFKYRDSDNYGIQVECNEDGMISFASVYDKIDADTVVISGRNYHLNAKTLTTVFENEIAIYNEDFTEVIETRDLKLIYTKQ